MPDRFSKLYTIQANSRSSSTKFNGEMDNIYTGLNTVDADLTTHKGSADHDTHTDTLYYRKTDVDTKINAATSTATVLSGTAFPASPNDGQLFWHKTLLTLFTYDITLGKWSAAKAPQLTQLLDPNKSTFSRASVAYGKDGTLYPFNAMRTAQGKYGQGAFIEKGTTNLLTANQSNLETDLTGLQVVGNQAAKGTLTRTTNEKWEGLASAQIVVAGYIANDDVSFSTTENGAGSLVSSNAIYTASAHVKAPVGVSYSMRVVEWNVGGTVVKETVSAMPAVGDGQWKPIELTVTTQSTTVRVSMRVSFHGNGTFYVDGLQIENKAYATTFITGGQTRQPDILSYKLSQPLPNINFGYLVWNPDVSSANMASRSYTLFSATDGGTSAKYDVAYSKSSGNLFFKKNGDNAQTVQISVTFNANDIISVGWVDDPIFGSMYLGYGINGGPLTIVSFANTTQVTGVTNVFVGNDYTGNSAANGTIEFPIVSDVIPTYEQAEALYRAADIGGNRHFPNNTQLLNQQELIAPTFSSGWTNYGNGDFDAGYMKDSMGFVRMVGTIKGGTIGSGSVFQLPVGYRPSRGIPFVCASNNGTADVVARGRIGDDGTVVIYSGGNTWLSLSSISFRAEH